MTDNIDDVFQGEERILVAAWMLPNEGELTDAQRRQAMENFREYAARHNLTYKAIAQQLGSPRATTIGDLVAGKYRSHADKHIRILNMWVEQHARSKAAATSATFVSTKVAREMLTIARLVRENETMGLCLGPCGIGKTRCAMAVNERYVGSIYLRIVTGYHTARGLIAGIADRLNVRQLRQSNSVERHQNQLERVMDTLRASHRMLIIDEGGKLKDAAIEVLRDLHDECGIPVLIVATADLHERIVQNIDPDHGQLYSRFDVVKHLTQGHDMYGGGKALFTVEDIRKLYSEPNLRLSKDADRFLHELSNALGHGSLRRCKMLVSNAARLARRRQHLEDGAKVTITANDLERVEALLRSESSELTTSKERRRLAAAVKQA